MTDSAVKILVVDCVDSDVPSSGALDDSFQVALRRCHPDVQCEKVRPSAADWAEKVGWADAVILGGSPRDAFDNDEWTHNFITKLRLLLESEKPLLGVCYGHQIMGRVCGAQVVRNSNGWELGEAVLELTPEGTQSPLLQGVSRTLRVIQTHRDCVVELPTGVSLLATNLHTEVQAAQFGVRAYGVQFHPELTGDLLREVWASRRDTWRGKVDFDIDASLDTAGECKDGLKVFENFLGMIG